MKKKFLLFASVGLLTLGTMSFYANPSITEKINSNGIEVSDSTPSIVMYNSIMKYADMYEIPKEYAFALAYQETRYKGPADVNYKQTFTSPSGALGPMQIMYSTAKSFIEDGEVLNRKLLKSDIDLNVKLSMRILRSLKDKHGTWGKAFGAYNTGRPIVNNYSKKILKKSYTWVMFSKPGAYIL